MQALISRLFSSRVDQDSWDDLVIERDDAPKSPEFQAQNPEHARKLPQDIQVAEVEGLPKQVHTIAMTHVTFGFWLRSIFSRQPLDQLQRVYDEAEQTRFDAAAYLNEHAISQEGGFAAMAEEALANFGNLDDVEVKLEEVTFSLSALQEKLDSIATKHTSIADKELLQLETGLIQQQRLLQSLVTALGEGRPVRRPQIHERLRANLDDRSEIFLQEAQAVLEDLIPRHLAGRMRASDLYWARQLFTREGIATALEAAGDRWARRHAGAILKELRSQTSMHTLEILHPHMMTRVVGEDWKVNPNEQIEMGRLMRVMLGEDPHALNAYTNQSARQHLEAKLKSLSTAHGRWANPKMVQRALEEQLKTEQTAIELMIAQNGDPAAVRGRILQLRVLDTLKESQAMLTPHFTHRVVEKAIRASRHDHASRLAVIDRILFARKTIEGQTAGQQRKLVRVLMERLPAKSAQVHLEILFDGQMPLEEAKAHLLFPCSPKLSVDEALKLKINAFYTLARHDALTREYILNLYDTSFGTENFRLKALAERSTLYRPLKRDLLVTVDALFGIVLEDDRPTALLLTQRGKQTLSQRIEAARSLGATPIDKLLDAQVKKEWFFWNKANRRALLMKRAATDPTVFESLEDNATAWQKAFALSPLAQSIDRKVGRLQGLNRVHRAGYAVIEWAEKLTEEAQELPSIVNALLELDDHHLAETYRLVGIPPHEIAFLNELTGQRINLLRHQLEEQLPSADVAKGAPFDDARREMRTTEATLAQVFGDLAANVADNKYFKVAVERDLAIHRVRPSERDEIFEAINLVVKTSTALGPFQTRVAEAERPEQLLRTREGVKYLCALSNFFLHYEKTLKIWRERVASLETDKPADIELALSTAWQRLGRWPMLVKEAGKLEGLEETEVIRKDVVTVVKQVNELKRRLQLMEKAN